MWDDSGAEGRVDSEDKPEALGRALITGASAGIGRELARAFAARGVDLVLLSRDRDALTALARELIGDCGVRVDVLPADLTAPGATRAIFEALAAENFDVDILGVLTEGDFSEIAWAEQERLLQLNIVALTALTRLFVAPCAGARRGRLHSRRAAGVDPRLGPRSAGGADAGAGAEDRRPLRGGGDGRQPARNAHGEHGMNRLSALDATFLYLETPETPMHVAGVATFTKPADGLDVFAAFRKHTAERLSQLPSYMRRPASTPLGLDHPTWVGVDHIDLDHHVRHLALPKPGNMAQLRELVARLHAVPLDRSRPLWEYYLIEGLESGGFVVYAKLHHSTMDGLAAMSRSPTCCARACAQRARCRASPAPRHERADDRQGRALSARLRQRHSTHAVQHDDFTRARLCDVVAAVA